MSDFEEGRASLHFVMTSLANETAKFRDGYAAFMRTKGDDSATIGLSLDHKSDDDEDDPDGYSLGFAAGRETFRQLAARSADFKAGWSYELRRPLEEQERAREFDRAVSKRADVLYREQKHFTALVEYKAATLRDPNQKSVPAPRTPDLDRLERVRIEKLAEARAVKARADQLVQEHRIKMGTAEFVVREGDTVVPRELGKVPTFGERLGYFKDVTALEFRDHYADEV
jgi:hypothetical protein